MIKHSLYGLYASGSDLPFYIGRTMRPAHRLRTHIQRAEGSERNTPKSNKIRKIIREGGDIRMEVLATTEDFEEVKRLEAEAIARYGRKDRGGILYNVTDGGDGVHGYKVSEQARKNISSALMGHKNTAREVSVYNETGQYLRTYVSQKDAADDLNVAPMNLSKCLNRPRIYCRSRDGIVYQFTRDRREQVAPVQ